MVREPQIRAKLVEVLQDELPLEEFADWLLSVRPDMYRSSTSEAQSLAASVSVLLYQYFEGNLPESVLREELVKIADNLVVSLELASSIRMQSSSISQQISVAFAAQV